MFIKKSFGIKGLIRFSGSHLIWLSAWSVTVTLLHEYSNWHWLIIPWFPITVIGTAVAFYLGFKNNSAYDRLWEARKIWGGIVNESRMWGSNIKAYVSNLFREDSLGDHDIDAIKKRLIYRHIAWLYTLRKQLLIPTPWEHVNQGKHVGNVARKRMKVFGLGLFDESEIKNVAGSFLTDQEVEKLATAKNAATQLIDLQSQELAVLRQEGLIDDFRHMDLQKLLNNFYTLQGKCERIKKFPLPRQYANMSFVFVGIFIFLLPFGMASEFEKLGPLGIWFSIPFTIIVGWVYLMMELVGDYSENPFEGLGNDIPMLSLCRTIEIDLREMLGESDLPEAIQPINDVLM